MIGVDLITRCPKCGHAVDHAIYGVSTRLGPPVVECPRCAQRFGTGRKEWAQLSTLEKVRFAALSLGYVFGSATGGAFGYQALHCTAFFGRCDGLGIDHWTWANAGPGGLLFGLLVPVVQWRRVQASRVRVSDPALAVPVPGTWDLLLGVQNKFRAAFIVMCLLSMLLMFGHIVFDDPAERARRAPRSSIAPSGRPWHRARVRGGHEAHAAAPGRQPWSRSGEAVSSSSCWSWAPAATA